MKVFLKGEANLEVDVLTGEAVLGSVKRRPIMGALSRLHYNPEKAWTVFSDIFAKALMLIIISGLLTEGHVQYAFMNLEQIERFYAAFYPKWNCKGYYELLKKLQVSIRKRSLTVFPHRLLPTAYGKGAFARHAAWGTHIPTCHSNGEFYFSYDSHDGQCTHSAFISSDGIYVWEGRFGNAG